MPFKPLTLAVFALGILAATQGFAACTSPTGTAGSVIFNSSQNVVQYCNGTNWVNTGAVSPTAPQTGCSSPTGTAGAVIYNNPQGVIQFCNGAKWVDTACAATRTPNGSGCGTSIAGSMRYVSNSNELQFCDSTSWTAMGWPCGAAAATGLVDWSLATQMQKVTAASGSNDAYFGQATAMNSTGDVAVIGASNAPGGGTSRGTAYVFTRSGTTWSQAAILQPSDLTDYSYFGSSVAIDGNSIIVGAYRANYDEGAAYVFTGSGSTWTQQARLSATPVVNPSNVGISVAIKGDDAIVGAYGENTSAGAAYIFTRSGSTWTQQARIEATNYPGYTDQAYDAFGIGVGIDGNTAMVGAGSYEPTGAVYVFTRSGSTWTQQQMIEPAGGQYVGVSIALEGTTAVFSSDGTKRAFVYTGSGGSWALQATLTTTSSTTAFGAPVSLRGDIAMVGDKQAPATNRGSAYAFKRTGTTWAQVKQFAPSDPANNDYFGTISFGGSYAVIGSEQDDDGGTNRGSAYFFGQ